MTAESALNLLVTQEQRVLVNLTVDSLAMVGSGAHCELRLPADKVAVEQLYLELTPSGLFGECRAKSPPVYLDGVPFTRGRLLPGSSLRIGELVIRPSVVTASVARPKSRKVPGIWLIGLSLLPVLGLLLWEPDSARGDSSFRAAPALFSAEPATCNETSAEVVRASASDWLREARELHERSAFSPESGIQAVAGYRRVAACLHRFGDLEGSTAAERDGMGLQKRLELDFHAHRVRLARALEGKDARWAAREVRALQLFVMNRPGAYAEWLDVLSRKLGLQLMDGTKKRKADK